MGEKIFFYEYWKENGFMKDIYWYLKCYFMKKINYYDNVIVDYMFCIFFIYGSEYFLFFFWKGILVIIV